MKLKNNNLKIVFRVDSSYEIGTGHLQRCLTLAQSLSQKGAEIYFICRKLPGNSISLIEQKKIKIFSLACDNNKIEHFDKMVGYAKWLREDLQIEIAQVRSCLQKIREIDWLVVDNYAIDVNWESELRNFAKKVMVIDDLANRNHDCDLLLDQNNTDLIGEYKKLVPSQCKLLLGSKYAMLRHEFIEARKTVTVRDGQVKRILVFMGGVDITNETKKVLKALQKIRI